VDPQQFFAGSRLVIVAGKGGVGKTTVTAALAVAAATCGLRTLVIEVEGRSGLPLLIGGDELGYDERVIRPASGGVAALVARTITPEKALIDYMEERKLGRLSKRLQRSGVLDVVATAAPGIDDLLVLGKVKQIERSGAYDLVIVDGPAAGHALTFLQSARGLADAVTVGPISTQARDVLAMLGDASRCQVILVTLPEETPVNELIETAFALEDRVGISLGPLVVNGLVGARDELTTDPDDAARAAGVTLDRDTAGALREAATFRRAIDARQRAELDRLVERLPLPQLHLPYVFTAGIGPADVDRLAALLLAGIGALAA
jgi:anion-transporting  ArsA/GET3 family ATPase